MNRTTKYIAVASVLLATSCGQTVLEDGAAESAPTTQAVAQGQRTLNSTAETSNISDELRIAVTLEAQLSRGPSWQETDAAMREAASDCIAAHGLDLDKPLEAGAFLLGPAISGPDGSKEYAAENGFGLLTAIPAILRSAYMISDEGRHSDPQPPSYPLDMAPEDAAAWEEVYFAECIPLILEAERRPSLEGFSAELSLDLLAASARIDASEEILAAKEAWDACFAEQLGTDKESIVARLIDAQGAAADTAIREVDERLHEISENHSNDAAAIESVVGQVESDLPSLLPDLAQTQEQERQAALVDVDCRLKHYDAVRNEIAVFELSSFANEFARELTQNR